MASRPTRAPRLFDPAPAEAEGPSSPPVTPEQVYRRYGPDVYRLARRLVGQEADAEDVAQEVLLQVVRKLGTFRGQADFRTWLHRVTVNAALLHRRKAARRVERNIRTPLERFRREDRPAGAAPSRSAAPEQEAINRETRQCVERALAGLPPIYRDVLVLAGVERLPNAEVGERLGLGLPAVKSRLHRARALMREALAPYLGEGYRACS